MSSSVFARTEKKYIITHSQAEALLCALGSSLKQDKWGESYIGNLYLDTPSGLLVRRSIEKPYYKEKLRVRTYSSCAQGKGVGETTGLPSLLARTGEQGTAYLELKKKLNGRVYKRRASMALAEARDFVSGAGRVGGVSGVGSAGDVRGTGSAGDVSRAGDISGAGSAGGVGGVGGVGGAGEPSLQESVELSQSEILQRQIKRELAYMIEHYGSLYGCLQPFLNIHYSRCAFEYAPLCSQPSAIDKLRITVDCDLAWMLGTWNGFSVQKGDSRLQAILPESKCILELKTLGAVPAFLSKLMSSLQIFPCSFSKVGRAYEAAMMAGCFASKGDGAANAKIACGQFSPANKICAVA